MTLQISAIYQGQYVPDTTAAKLAFTSLNAILNGGTAVPAGVQVLLTSLVVVNPTGSVATLELWRGTGATAPFSMLGGPINVAPNEVVQVLTAPIVLMAGDSIWGLAGTHDSLVVTGDGEVLVQ